jgi:L-amino acid N-acyltransferase YncA
MKIRKACSKDLEFILHIYNEGIEDRIATLETEQKDITYIAEWFHKKSARYPVVVAENQGIIQGWATISPYNSRTAYRGVGEISVYIKRDYRGKGIGKLLLDEIERLAKINDFHKLLLFTFPFNTLGQGLYKSRGYHEVGTFKNQGILDGKFVDVMAMEKLLGGT